MTDIFPAVVSVYPAPLDLGWVSPFSTVGFGDSGAIRFTECRVIVHKNTLIVGTEGARGPAVAYKADVVEVFVEKPYTRVLLADGSLVVFGRSKGCGCGSRLRSWNPYGGIVGSSRD